MALILEHRLIDELNDEHEPHKDKSTNPFCRVCIFNCAHHIQREDKDAERSRELLSAIPVSKINDAIREVSTALDDHELVRPFPLSGGKQSL